MGETCLLKNEPASYDCMRVSRRDGAVVKASLNRRLVCSHRPEARRSIHVRLSGKITGGPNQRSLKRPWIGVDRGNSNRVGDVLFSRNN